MSGLNEAAFVAASAIVGNLAAINHSIVRDDQESPQPIVQALCVAVEGGMSELQPHANASKLRMGTLALSMR